MQIHVVMDSENPQRIAPFWCDLLDMRVTKTYDDGTLVLRSDRHSFILGIQHVPEPKTVKNRVHIDVLVDDLDTSTAQVTSLGGTELDASDTLEVDGFPWRVVADPEGNEFCIYTLASTPTPSN